MRCTAVLEFDNGEGTAVGRVELMRLHRDSADPITGDVGISLIEGKTLLQTVQQEFVVAQLGRYCVRNDELAERVAQCADCTTVIARV